MIHRIFEVSLRFPTIVLLTVSAVLGSTNSSSGGEGSWVAKAPLPNARTEPAFGSVNGLLYVAGGEDGFSALNVLEVYDSATNTWTTKAPMPTARFGAASAVINGKLYVAGGASLTGQLYNTLEVYDPGTDSWTTKAPMPTARNVPGFGVINGLLYVVGGNSSSGGGGYTNLLEVYDPVTDTWATKAPMPTVRAFPAGAELNGKLYVVGGAPPESVTGALEAYDPATDTWTSKAPMPTARYVHVAASLNGLLYAIGGDPSAGGESSESVINEVYDPSTDTWSTEGSMPTARWGMAAGVIGGTLYVIGGAKGPGNGVPQSVSEAFTPVFSPPVLAVAIDIKPGSFPNSINPRNNGVVPVALLTTSAFDATTANATTVRFGANGTEADPVHVTLADVDGDGDTDMILHFRTQQTGITFGATSASLTGSTFGGLAIKGSDSVNTVGGR
jgi:N-acetylneuraminic acid mutarotase